MRDEEAEALADIAGAFAMRVRYTGAGLADGEIDAVKSDDAAAAFQGPGEGLRTISFEVAQAALPQRPRKTDTLVEVDSGAAWKVNDITRRDDLAAWLLIVEEAE